MSCALQLHQTFLCAVGMRKWSSFWEKIFQTKTENILSQNETTFSFHLISPEKVLIGLSLVFVCMVCLLVLCVQYVYWFCVYLQYVYWFCAFLWYVYWFYWFGFNHFTSHKICSSLVNSVKLETNHSVILLPYFECSLFILNFGFTNEMDFFSFRESYKRLFLPHLSSTNWRLVLTMCPLERSVT